MKTNQKGFTLIELMIAVAIVGILASVALPAYENYTTRAKLTEIDVLMKGMKTELHEEGANNNRWLSETTGDAIAADIATRTDYLVDNTNAYTRGGDDLDATESTVIFTIGGTGSAADGETLTFTYDWNNGISVECSTSLGAENYSLLPPECRSATTS